MTYYFENINFTNFHSFWNFYEATLLFLQIIHNFFCMLLLLWIGQLIEWGVTNFELLSLLYYCVCVCVWVCVCVCVCMSAGLDIVHSLYIYIYVPPLFFLLFINLRLLPPPSPRESRRPPPAKIFLS